MKKIISILIAIMLILQINIVAFAAQAPTVTSDDVVLTEDETLIPVKIEHNSGLMGYKITVKYDKTKIEVCSVTKGNVSSKGNFITNFDAGNNIFDVVWNNTDNITSNGNLFVISAKAKKNISGKTEINLSYSKPDTFDVTYTDVPLNCENINVTIKEDGETSVSTSNSANKELSDNTYVADDSQILDVINALLLKKGKTSLDEIDNKEEFLKELNENLNIVTASNKNNITDFDYLKALYKRCYQNAFIKEVEDNIDDDTVDKIISNSLKEYGADDIKDLKDEDKKSFIATVQTELQKADKDVPDISDKLSNDDVIETFEKLKDNNKETKEKDKKQKESSKKGVKKSIIIISSAFCLLILFLVFFFVNFIKKKK